MSMSLALGLGLPFGGATAGIPTGVPVNSVAPSISGIRTVGQTLTANPGSWSQFPTSFTYTWNKNGTPNGATTQTYIPVAGDSGATLTVSVTATNSFGNSTAATSAGAAIAAALSISGAPGTSGTVGGAYSFTPTTSGGHTTYVFSLTGSIGASGLSFSTSTGALTASSLGPAATYGAYTITVTDADGLTASLTPFSIVVSSGTSHTADNTTTTVDTTTQTADET